VAGETKRSVTLAGHRTSVSLEAPFWDELTRIAGQRNLSVNELIRRVDADRARRGDLERSLSSALRVFVLEELRGRPE